MRLTLQTMLKGEFLPSAKPHGQQVAFGVVREGGREEIQENHLQQVALGVVREGGDPRNGLDLEVTLK